MSLIRFAMAQINPLVGDICANAQQVIEVVQQVQHCVDVIVFPELTLSGYPPEDLLLRPSLTPRIEQALSTLQQQSFSATVILGYPKRIEGALYNMVGVLHQGQWLVEYAKQCLPNYQVFDERRYFCAGKETGTFSLHGVCMGLAICEDIWHPEPLAALKAQGMQLLISINASPFSQTKAQQRKRLMAQRLQTAGVAGLYVNQWGGQDELVFDGASFALNTCGQLAAQGKYFAQDILCVDYSIEQQKWLAQALPAPLQPEAMVYQALVTGLRDYVNKNGFKQVVLGLSGGIDSALTLAIAVDALGAERVRAIMMPFRYTSLQSKEDASAQAHLLKVAYESIEIEPMYNAFMAGLSEQFAGLPIDLTEQNLQARCRGVILMALSNKTNALVLTTGNKSELAVGYSTLYGDMAGGFDVLKDVPKTQVFALARFRNTQAQVIPASVISRPPSAELAPDQKDEDNLPPYETLDAILDLYIDHDSSAEAIIAQGFCRETVEKVIRLVDMNEYKRRQAPVGVRLSERGFGRDRRYPITHGWRAGI